MTPAQILLSDCIDYAGLFPPSGLDLQRTVENYAAYKAGADNWALGRLVLPVEKLDEFTQRSHGAACGWPVAVVVRGDVEHELRTRLEGSSSPHVIAVECGPLPLHALDRIARHVPPATTLYVEVHFTDELEETIAAISDIEARAKIRTGGITANSIPSAQQVARFMACCVQHRVPFKATAGLHHAIHGMRALTYEPGSERASMQGFLNVLLAAALLADGGDVPAATALLEESSPANFRFTPEDITWRDRTFSAQLLAETRKTVMLSFGSCSFAEPLEEMRAAGLLA